MRASPYFSLPLQQCNLFGMSPTADPKVELFRHTLSTLAYRGGKAIREAPAGFADFNAGEGVRTPGQLLAHIGDLFDWALSIAKGQQVWNNSTPLPWEEESERFFETITKFDKYLTSGEPINSPLEKLFQGPVADALVHVGQIIMLRRLAGAIMKSENYHKASIEVGRVGADQVAPKREF
jgi:hypothetical protein